MARFTFGGFGGDQVSGTGTTHSTNATHTGFSYQFFPGAN